MYPGGGLDISVHTGISGVFFWVLNFENLNFFGYWSELLYFLGCQTNAVLLSVLCFRQ